MVNKQGDGSPEGTTYQATYVSLLESMGALGWLKQVQEGGNSSAARIAEEVKVQIFFLFS